MGNLLAVMGEHLEEFRLTEAEFEPLLEAKASFAADLDNHTAQSAIARSARQRKDTSRQRLETMLRPILREMNNSRAMTNPLRGAMGLPQRSGVRSARSVPGDAPGLVLQAYVGSVIIHFGTAPNNELLNKKPEGVKGCNIFRRKAGESGFRLIDFASSSPYIDTISGPAEEYTYYVQYRGTRPSDLGSSSAEQTIAARGPMCAAAQGR